MTGYLTQNWIVRKPLARSRGGIVASQSCEAAKVGTRVLAEGGNAVDAAVAAGFALAALEPWNSGLGGIGFMIVKLAHEKRAHVIDFGAVAPRRLDPADFPLTGGLADNLFPWPRVKDDRNVHGALSVAVPGEVDGLGLALERFGTLRFAAALAPAIALAEQGLPIDWFTTLKTAVWAQDLSRYAATRAVWLPGGFAPVPSPDGVLTRLPLPGLAATLRGLAERGRRDFYEGAIARAIAEDMRAAGGVLDAEDLAAYRARIVAPLEVTHRGARLSLAGGLTAGPTMAEALAALPQGRGGAPDADWFVGCAAALRQAYEKRLAGMGDAAPTSTTHLCAIDRHGNLVALTQTLLSVFGSKVLLPQTGVLMNNGIMWFDPQPGGANSLAPGRRPLSNMCPVVAQRADGAPWLALGASGGRSILPAVLQVLSFVADHGMGLDDAVHQPRIDVSGGALVVADPRLPEPVRAALAQRFPTRLLEYRVQPGGYACPCIVLADANGDHLGSADVMSPWSAAVAEDATESSS